MYLRQKLFTWHSTLFIYSNSVSEERKAMRGTRRAANSCRTVFCSATFQPQTKSAQWIDGVTVHSVTNNGCRFGPGGSNHGHWREQVDHVVRDGRQRLARQTQRPPSRIQAFLHRNSTPNLWQIDTTFFFLLLVSISPNNCLSALCLTTPWTDLIADVSHSFS
jgi:hypothetical protein